MLVKCNDVFFYVYRQSHGRNGLSNVQIVFAIVMKRAHNPIDFSVCMMSRPTLTKIGKKKKHNQQKLMLILIVRFYLLI